MFEYHGNNLTVDADGVSVTVALAEPLDIEKPLVDADITGAKVTAGKQSVVDYIPSIVMDEIVNMEPYTYITDYPCLKGYAPFDYVGPDRYGGWASEEVFERAIPYLEMGFRGLLAFCTDEKNLLTQELERLQERAKELEKIRQEEAAELERVMPSRNKEIAFKELETFAVSLGIDLTSNIWDTAYLHKVNDRDIQLGWIISFDYDGIGPHRGRPGGPRARGKDEGIVAHQDKPANPHNLNLRIGAVYITERGYFGVNKKESISDGGEDDAEYRIGYLTPHEALEAAAKFVSEGEEFDWREGPVLPGLPMPPKNRE